MQGIQTLQFNRLLHKRSNRHVQQVYTALLLLQRAGVRIVIPVTQCKNSAGRGKGEVQSPWHGHRLPDGELLVIAALLILEDTLIASGRPQQRHTALLVRAVPGNAVLDDNSTLWRVIAGHQAVTCTTAWLPEPIPDWLDCSSMPLAHETTRSSGCDRFACINTYTHSHVPPLMTRITSDCALLLHQSHMPYYSQVVHQTASKQCNSKIELGQSRIAFVVCSVETHSKCIHTDQGRHSLEGARAARCLPPPGSYP